MTEPRRYRAGESIEDFCRACKTDRMHTVVAADGDGRPIRVSCGFCHSEHNYRGGPRVGDQPAAEHARPLHTAGTKAQSTGREPFPIVSERARTAPPMAIDRDTDVELLLRRIIREVIGISPVAPA